MSPMKTHWLMVAAVLGGGLVGWTLPALSQPPGSVPLTNGFVDRELSTRADLRRSVPWEIGKILGKLAACAYIPSI
jgi:hypothetical protein